MMVETFEYTGDYKRFVNESPFPIEIVSVVVFDGTLVVTFKRA